MAKRYSSSRRPSILLPLVLVLVLPLVLLGGTLGTLVALGIELPFLKSPEPPALRIPANLSPLAAYHRVSRDDLIDFQTGQIHYLKMPPESAVGSKLVGTTLAGEAVEGVVQSVAHKEIQGATYPVFLLASGEEVPLPNVDEVGGALLRLNKVIGRVLDREKSPNFGFTESNFLPEGTRSGTVGGVPRGMKAYTLEAGKLIGIHGLKIGDKIDLLASIPLEKISNGGSLASNGVIPASLVVDPSSKSHGSEYKEPRLVASDAQVIAPVYRRSKTTTSSSLIDGTSTRSTPVEEVVLAVHEADIPTVTEVLALDVPIAVVAHSGRPKEEEDETPPEGMVRVVVTPRETIPYTEIFLSQLIPGGAQKPRTILLAKEQVADLQILTTPEQIAGRVVRRVKAPGTFFTESDLFPRGTSPGFAAAVPTGKVAYTIDTAKIDGIAGLGLGDHFDLVATRPVDFQKMAQRIGAADLAVSSAIRQGALRLDAGAHTEVIVRGATVIAPPGSTALRVHGTKAQGKSRDAVEPMIIAVTPEEVSQISEVLATKVHLTAILRGIETVDAAPIPDSVDPTQSVHVLDSMIGRDREPIVFIGNTKNGPAKPLNLQDLVPAEGSQTTADEVPE